MMVPWPPGRGRGPASRSGGPSPRRTRRGSCASTTSWNPGASAARCCAGKGFTPGASFSQVLHFGVFRSCGEVEVFDGGRVVAAEVVFAAVAFLVVVHVCVEVGVDDDGAELEDGLGSVGGPSGACDSESVFDDESAGALDHAGGDRPAFLECLVVAHVPVVVREVGDGLVHVGEVKALAGAGAGFRGDGGEGGGHDFRAAVQDAEPLPVAPLALGGGVAGVESGGGLAEGGADVGGIDKDRELE